jgi:hypothetical protein
MRFFVVLSAKTSFFVFFQTNTLSLSALFVCKLRINQKGIKVINISCETQELSINFA